MHLRQIVWKLIDLKKEGDYWDFKLKHHENPVDLVHDILCLANNVHAQGYRFLIFGVDPADCSIKGLEEINPNKQANIIDTLSAAPFAGGIYPNIQLQNLEIDGKTLQVLSIKDSTERPFYLEKSYEKKGKKIKRWHHIQPRP